MAKKKAAKAAPKAVKSKKAAPKKATAPKAFPQKVPLALHHLTVVNGKGTGLYLQGAKVTIEANPALAGQVFDQWSGPVVDPASAKTTVTMPASNLTVTANYKAAPAVTTPPVKPAAPPAAPKPVTPAPAARNWAWFAIPIGIVLLIGALLIALSARRPAGPASTATVAAKQTVEPAVTSTPAARPRPTSTLAPVTATKAPAMTATPIALPTEAPATATPPRGLAPTSTVTQALTATMAPTQTVVSTPGSAVTTLDEIVDKGRKPPFETMLQDEDHGVVTTLEGFDLKDSGGDDSGCTRTELDAVALREEVGSPNENCKIVIEWSLKYQATTIVSGVYPLKPGEWLRIEGNVSGEDRFVGTLWYLPTGWASHMYAANIAADWQPKNPGLVTIVGLSPTDPWVVGLAKMLAALPK